MTESFVFRIPTVSKDKIDFVYDLDLNLKKILSNNRTTIYQNEELRLCVDAKTVRVKVFDKTNLLLIENLREFFYGEQYKKL